MPASPLLLVSFVVLALLVAAALVAGVARTSPRAALPVGAALAAWLALTAAAAARGRLSFESRPPTEILVILAGAALAVGLARSRVGERLALGLPLAALVGAQGFRLPLELLLHRAYDEGLMPVQMSYAGRNFDIVTGVTALVVAALLARGGPSLRLALVWNVLGSLLLLNIVTIAILSAPTPVRVFMNEPANVWVTRAPWVWLPTLFVPAALLGHLLVFRRLRAERGRVTAAADVAAMLGSETGG